MKLDFTDQGCSLGGSRGLSTHILITGDKDCYLVSQLSTYFLEVHLMAAMLRLCASCGLRHILVYIGPRRALST